MFRSIMFNTRMFSLTTIKQAYTIEIITGLRDASHYDYFSYVALFDKMVIDTCFIILKIPFMIFIPSLDLDANFIAYHHQHNAIY